MRSDFSQKQNNEYKIATNPAVQRELHKNKLLIGTNTVGENKTNETNRGKS